MKTRNYLLSALLGLIAFTGVVQANSGEPLIFTSQPEIPASIPTNANPSCYAYVIKNTLTTDSLPLIISLAPNTDARISINDIAGPSCPATDCGDTLEKGKSCTIIVKVDPSQDATPSQAAETLTIEYSPRYGALESDPPIVIDFVQPPPAILQFSVLPDPPAQVVIGDAAIPFTYTIKNIGEQTAEDITPSISQREPENCEPSLISFVSSSCVGSPYSLAPGASCTLTYEVEADTADPVDCDLNVQNEYTLNVSYDGVGSPLQSNIDFYVVQPDAFLNFSEFPDNLPPAVILGEVSADFTYTIKNYGTATANIGSITNTTDPDPTPEIVTLVSDTCGATLAAGDTCTLTYNLDATGSPPPTVRYYTNILSIPYDNATASPLQTQYSFGVADSAAILSLELTSGPIGSIQIPASNTITFTLTNLGNADATNLTPVIDEDYGFIVPSGGTCGSGTFDLTMGTSCTLEYTITPVVVGTSKQQLNITYDVTPGNPAVVSGAIDFYAYTTTPLNAYVAYSNVVLGIPFVSDGRVKECPINPTTGSISSCGSAVPISGVTSLDFSGTHAFTSAYYQPLYLNDKVQRCTAHVFGGCVTTASFLNANASYGSFIKFYTPSLAYLSKMASALLLPDSTDTVQLCNVNAGANTISCNNAWPSHHIAGPTAISLLKLNAVKQYAYVLNKTTDSLLLCTINAPSGTFTNCVDSGAANLFQLSGTLDLISAGDLYTYVPLQIDNSQVDILRCKINADGTLSGCISVKSFNASVFHPIIVSSIKVISAGGPFSAGGNPVAYIGYVDGLGTNHLIACDVAPDGSLATTCTSALYFPEFIQGINAR